MLLPPAAAVSAEKDQGKFAWPARIEYIVSGADVACGSGEYLLERRVEEEIAQGRWNVCEVESSDCEREGVLARQIGPLRIPHW